MSVLSCPVCDVGVLWPNGLTDEDETWHAGRPRPWPHCVRWGPSFPSPKRAQPPSQFSAHICCGKMAAWIKMPLGMEVGRGPGDFALDGDPALPSPKGAQPPIFGPYPIWPNDWTDQDATWYGGRPRPKRLCVRWGRPPSKKGAAPLPQFSAYIRCGQTAGWIKMVLGMEVGLSPGDFVLEGDPAPIFGQRLLWPNGWMD